MVKAEDVGRFTSNYAPFGGALIPFDPAASSIYLDPPPYPFGGGGLVSSARDYDRFLAMLLGEGQIGGATSGVRVMKPETARLRSEEHTSELQSLMRISYAVFC